MPLHVDCAEDAYLLCDHRDVMCPGVLRFEWKRGIRRCKEGVEVSQILHAESSRAELWRLQSYKLLLLLWWWAVYTVVAHLDTVFASWLPLTTLSKGCPVSTRICTSRIFCI